MRLLNRRQFSNRPEGEAGARGPPESPSNKLRPVGGEQPKVLERRERNTGHPENSEIGYNSKQMTEDQYDALRSMVEPILRAVRPEELPLLPESDCSGPEVKGGFLSFGSPEGITLLLNATVEYLKPFTSSALKALGEKLITALFELRQQPAASPKAEELEHFVLKYRRHLQKRGFTAHESELAADCLSRTILRQPQLLRSLISNE